MMGAAGGFGDAESEGEINRDLGEQPLAGVMAANGLKPAEVVAASTEQITFKMVSRAVKGRRLTANVQGKIVRAVSRAAGREYSAAELFNYAGR